jgi:hypothetical protein
MNLAYLRSTLIKLPSEEVERRNEQGSIVLEASLIMPLFLALILAMISILSIAITDIALYAGVSETTKQVAAHMYPVQEIASTAMESEWGTRISEWISKVRTTRQTMDAAAQEADLYAHAIPESLLIVLDQYRQLTGTMDQFASEQWNRMLSAAFEPMLASYLDSGVWPGGSRPKVVKVVFPNLLERSNPYFGIEAEYTLRLPIPFVTKTITLRHKAYERIWIGN